MSYRVYFGRLPDTLSQDDFEKLLEQYGKAKNIEWKSGYAYVDYKHGSDASNTVQNLNGKEIGGNNILVELAQNGAGGYSIAGGFSARLNKPLPRPIRTPHRARIENLSSRAKWMELKELLSLAGEVTFADTHKRTQGEGIVEFANKQDLVEAIKMFDRTSFFGRTIRLYDESPRNRSRNHKRSRSRSHSHRRSSPVSKDRKKKSRSRSTSPDRKVSHSDRRSEVTKKVRSKSTSPRRKPQKSPSSSPTRHISRKQRSSSRTPPTTKSSRHSQRKSKKSKQDLSRSRSKSPRQRKKHKVNRTSEKRKHKQSHSSSSDNETDKKRKSKTTNKKKQSSSSESKSDSGSSSNEASESGHK